MMEACGIDVFRTARNNGFEVDTRKETFARWNYFALVLIEYNPSNYVLTIKKRRAIDPPSHHKTDCRPPITRPFPSLSSTDGS